VVNPTLEVFDSANMNSSCPRVVASAAVLISFKAPYLIEHLHLFAPRSDDDLAGDPASIIAGRKATAGAMSFG
jgi:hypothetical protein